MMGNKKLKAYTFIKNAGSQFNLLQGAEPMNYFTLLLNDELLNSSAIETDSYVREKIRNSN
jgi:hypothetical protein